MTFNELNLNNPLHNALSDLNYTQPTPIQERVFSVVMSGADVIGIAQTGTGKTLGYLLPCLRQWKFTKSKAPQILILVPTRELVIQVVEDVQKLSTYMNLRVCGVYGGTNIRTQITTVTQGQDVVVATPGRLYDLAMAKAVKLTDIKQVVIDEVDEMLNLGFRPQLSNILELLPERRQNLMFSATLTEEVDAFLMSYFVNPQRVEAAPAGSPLSNITQSAYETPNFLTKLNLLTSFLEQKDEYTKVLVFAASKKMADVLFEYLEPEFGNEMGIIHSNKAQNTRFATMSAFKNSEPRILIATDLVARGLDISEVTHVINFDLPDVPENYIHRIGRTGRADKTGIAIAFITEKETQYQEAIERLMNYQIPLLPFPPHIEQTDERIPEEIEQVKMPNIIIKGPKDENVGASHHERSPQNIKTNVHLRRSEKLKVKYKKPKTRGSKTKPKR